MNPDFYERYYDECYDLHKRRYELINSYYENDANFTERDNEQRYSARDLDYQCELESKKLIKEYEDEIERLELKNIQLEQEMSSMNETIKKAKMMEELLNQYALYSEIDFDRTTYTLIL